MADPSVASGFPRIHRPPSHPGRGLFVTLEGGDGAGKTTLIQGLSRHLAAEGHRLTVTREPGGTEGAEAIRHLLITGSGDRWEPLAEVLLLYAARLDHVRRVILPALAAGGIVLCDRFADSTLAYQGYGHGLDHEVIATVRRQTLGDFGPDQTLILDLSPEQGLERTSTRRGDEHRFEQMERAFHERLRQGFLSIAANEPQRCSVIDATQAAESVLQQALAVLAPHLPVPAGAAGAVPRPPA